MINQYKIALVGLPGSGKTTLAKLIAERKNICHVSTGQILREMVKSGADLEVKKQLDSGEMVDDVLAAQVVQSKISNEECKNGYVLDGYPKTAGQLDIYHPGFNFVFLLELPEEVAKRRLIERGRPDDFPDIIKHRFDLYRKESSQLIPQLEKNENLIRINTNQSIEEVYQSLDQYL